MKRLLIAAAVLLGAIAVACYQDDALHPVLIAPTKVFLTDAPFPYDTVSSVNVYVVRIEASPRDTAPADAAAGRETWVEIAAPKQSFNLLTLQQGATAFLGQSTLDAGQYLAIRMTLDVDKSSIKYLDGSDAVVRWPNPGQGEVVFYAGIPDLLAVSASGAEIVIDFDVGRTFRYMLFGIREFDVLPVVRAVNSAAAGAIVGTVTAPDIEGTPFPVQNANITIYGGNPSQPPGTWYVEATGRTDAQGRYKVAFLGAGAYIVRVEQPDLPAFAAVTTSNVLVTVGDTTSHSVVLPPAGAGGAFINITGPSSVGVGGTIALRAAVGDSNGIPQANPQVSWFSSDSSIAMVLQDSGGVNDSVAYAFVLGRREGSAWIRAQSGLLWDSIAVQVIKVEPLVPVASVTLTPASMTLAVGDSNSFTAVLRDSDGNVLSNRQISWFLTDSSGVATIIWSAGETAWVMGGHSGTTHIRAASESKIKDATITVP